MYAAVVLFMLCCSQILAQVCTLSGSCSITRSYCGGIAPRQDEYAQLTAAQPYQGKVLFIKPGRFNSNTVKPIAQTYCDSLGQYKFKVKPGTYCIVQAEHNLNFKTLLNRVQGQYLQCNTKCLQQWWQKGLLVIQVNADTSVKVLEFHQGCFKPGDIPCIDYFGPMPP